MRANECSSYPATLRSPSYGAFARSLKGYHIDIRQIPRENKVREHCKAKTPHYYIQTIAHHFAIGSACTGLLLDDMFLSADEDTLV